jgi:molecular chaperone GrpE (heat shock protein)
MTNWLGRLRNLATESLAAPAADAPDAERETQLASFTELGRKTARAVTRLEVRLESIEAALAQLVARGERRDDDVFAPLMDALDGLDAAGAALASGHHDGSEAGLTTIQQRLTGMLERAGYARHAALGVPVDGRLQRVVGAQADERRPHHSVLRVVRAAVTRGDAIVRAGEVIAVKNFASAAGSGSSAQSEMARAETQE